MGRTFLVLNDGESPFFEDAQGYVCFEDVDRANVVGHVGIGLHGYQVRSYSAGVILFSVNDPFFVLKSYFAGNPGVGIKTGDDFIGIFYLLKFIFFGYCSLKRPFLLLFRENKIQKI